MLEILVGTNRPESRSGEIAQILQGYYQKLEQPCQIMNLADLPLNQLKGDYKPELPSEIVAAVERISQADGLHIVVPEYNGSMPGALKYFIDHWKYPESFEHRPVAFVGLGGRFGGLRPVEHLQQVFGYRNGYVFPDRVFLMNIWTVLKDGILNDEHATELLKAQTQGFCRFIKALKSEKLHPLQALREK